MLMLLAYMHCIDTDIISVVAMLCLENNIKLTILSMFDLIHHTTTGNINIPSEPFSSFHNTEYTGV